MVKIRTDKEIEFMTISNKIVAETLDLVTEYVKVGAAPAELDQLAEDFIRSHDARPAFKGYMGYPSTLCISIDDAVVHGIPNGKVFEEGQIVGIDCGVEKSGYYGDHARTYNIGEVDKDKKELMKVTKAALEIGISKAQPGGYISDIGYAIQTYVESKGYSVVRELVGHGIGTELHEEPQVPNFGSPQQGYRIKPGMCLAIEPMINLGSKEIYTDSDGWTVRTKDGKPSAHYEHTIVILKDGPQILSKGDNYA
ncbi:type I methionyl aminopeptidase [Candidatus Neomarinimicrobiota bacterium]